MQACEAPRHDGWQRTLPLWPNFAARFAFLLGLLLSIATVTNAVAQVPPPAAGGPRNNDVGEQLRDVTPKPVLPQPRTPDIEGLPGEPTKPAEDEGPKIKVESWLIEGNTAYDTAELQELLADTIGEELSLGGLQDAVSKISLKYRKDGYPLAQAYLPPQTIEDGVVHVTVVEGRIGKVSLSDEKQEILDEDLVQSFLETIPQGALVEDRSINRLALTVGDLPGVNAKVTLQPGEAFGTTDVVVALEEDDWWQASVDTDNFGSYSTGRYREGITASTRNLTGLGDELDFRGQRTSYGQLYGSLGGTIALSGRGDRLGISISHLGFSLGGIYTGAGGGEATVLEINYRYPIIRDIQSTLIASAVFDHRLLSTTSPSLDDARTEEIGNVGVNYTRLDAWGITTFQTAGYVGSIAFDNNLAESEDQTDGGPQTRGSFAKMTYGVTRLETLYAGFSLYGSLNGQYTGDKRLDAVESFSLGGPSGVRAYPLGETQGDAGYLGSFELRFTPEDWNADLGTPTVYSFYDYGEITQHPGIDPLTDKPRRRGWGFGLQYAIGKIQTNFIIGFPLTGNPHSVPSFAPQTLYYQLSAGF